MRKKRNSYGRTAKLIENGELKIENEKRNMDGWNMDKKTNFNAEAQRRGEKTSVQRCEPPCNLV
jgi:hypothetical protein